MDRTSHRVLQEIACTDNSWLIDELVIQNHSKARNSSFSFLLSLQIPQIDVSIKNPFSNRGPCNEKHQGCAKVCFIIVHWPLRLGLITIAISNYLYSIYHREYWLLDRDRSSMTSDGISNWQHWIFKTAQLLCNNSLQLWRRGEMSHLDGYFWLFL